MKINKKGIVRLEPNEIRVGNFFVCREGDYMKMTDLSMTILYRVHRRLPIGIWLENIWLRCMNADESALVTMKTYIGTMFSVFAVAPDDGYITDALTMSRAALERHPDWYGVKAGGDDEEALRSVREMNEFEDDMRKLKESGK